MTNSYSSSLGYAPTNDSIKTQVANYLLDNVGQWVDSADIEVIGGTTATRRMRELRENGWTIHSRTAPGARTRQYFLAKSPAKTIVAKHRTVAKVATSR